MKETLSVRERSDMTYIHSFSTFIPFKSENNNTEKDYKIKHFKLDVPKSVEF